MLNSQLLYIQYSIHQQQCLYILQYLAKLGHQEQNQVKSPNHGKKSYLQNILISTNTKITPNISQYPLKLEHEDLECPTC